ncbi:MAG: hypothetical protein ACKO5R_05330 [Planctomycetaceae bacterium]
MSPVPPSMPLEPADVAGAAEEEVRRASLEERGRMVARAVRSAMRIDRSRRAAGLPEPVPESWPASTLAYLRRHAAASRGRSGASACAE